MQTMTDVLWDTRNDKDWAKPKAKYIDVLVSRDMEKIRQMFKDGYTAFIVPQSYMAEIRGKKDVEIRVYDGEKLLGVIINSEINY